MIRTLLILAVCIGHVLAYIRYYHSDTGKCGCCPKWCSCLCDEEICAKIRIAVAEDSSSSLNPQEWSLSKTFVGDVLTGVDCPGNKIAHITYSTNITVDWTFDSVTGMSLSSSMAALQNLDQFEVELTNIVEAMEVLVDEIFINGNNPSIPNVALMLNDGKATHNVHRIPEVAQQLQALAKVIVVGVGSGVNVTQLELVATGPGSENVFLVPDFASLPTVVLQVVDTILSMVKSEPGGDACVCCCPPPEAFPVPHYYEQKQGCGCH